MHGLNKEAEEKVGYRKCTSIIPPDPRNITMGGLYLGNVWGAKDHSLLKS